MNQEELKQYQTRWDNKNFTRGVDWNYNIYVGLEPKDVIK